MAGEGLIVREAGPKDAGAVHDLLVEFNGEAPSPGTLARRMEQIARLETVFLAERDGSPAGLLVLRTVQTLCDVQDWAEITELYVRVPQRRQGIGSALVFAAVEHSRNCGCTELHLLVDPANHGANAFYRAAGFLRDSCALRRDV